MGEILGGRGPARPASDSKLSLEWPPPLLRGSPLVLLSLPPAERLSSAEKESRENRAVAEGGGGSRRRASPGPAGEKALSKLLRRAGGPHSWVPSRRLHANNPGRLTNHRPRRAGAAPMISSRGGHYADFTGLRVKPRGEGGGAGGRGSGAAAWMKVEEGEEPASPRQRREVRAETGKGGVEALGSGADDLTKILKEKPRCAAPCPPSRHWAFAAPFQAPLQPSTDADLWTVVPGLGGGVWNSRRGEEAPARHRTSLPDFLTGPSRFLR